MFKALYTKLAKKNRGFTLIELIVVIAILGILIAIMVPSMVGFIGSAKEASVKAEAKTIYTAAQAFITNEIAIQGKAATTLTEDNCITTLNTAKLIDSQSATGDVKYTLDSTDHITLTSFTYTKDGITVIFPAGTVSK